MSGSSQISMALARPLHTKPHTVDPRLVSPEVREYLGLASPNPKETQDLAGMAHGFDDGGSGGSRAGVAVGLVDDVGCPVLWFETASGEYAGGSGRVREHVEELAGVLPPKSAVLAGGEQRAVVGAKAMAVTSSEPADTCFERRRPAPLPVGGGVVHPALTWLTDERKRAEPLSGVGFNPNTSPSHQTGDPGNELRFCATFANLTCDTRPALPRRQRRSRASAARLSRRALAALPGRVRRCSTLCVHSR